MRITLPILGIAILPLLWLPSFHLKRGCNNGTSSQVVQEKLTFISLANSSSNKRAIGLSVNFENKKDPSNNHAIPIIFESGMLSCHKTGALTNANDHTVSFSVKVQKNERLIVNLVPKTHGLLLGGTVKFPDGTFDGQHGGVITSKTCSESGIAYISVEPNSMGTERMSGTFVIEVLLLPSYLQSQN